MLFNAALNVLDRHPNAVIVGRAGRSDKAIQYVYYKGSLSWTAGFTAGGTVLQAELAKLQAASDTSWEVFATLQSTVPLN